MSVDTVAYSIPPKMMRKIRAENENLDYVFGNSDEENPEWQFESLDFGKRFDENRYILRAGGFAKTPKILELESYYDTDDYIEHDGCEVQIIKPSLIKIVVKELEKVDFAKLKSECLEQQVTDYYGEIILEFEYDSYLESIRQMNDFLVKAAAEGNFVIFATC
jgi:hypothetical protein